MKHLTKKILITSFLAVSISSTFAEEIPVKKIAGDVKTAESNNIVNMKSVVKWRRPPRVYIQNDELKGYDRRVSIAFGVDINGNITSATVKESSGLEQVDTNVLNAVKKAKFYPYQEDGIYYPIIAVQPFEFMVSRQPKYKIYPKIYVKKADINDQSREISIYAEADSQGNLTKSVISKSSGLIALDNYVLSEYRKQAKFYPLVVNGKPYPISHTARYKFSNDQNTID